MAVSLSKGGNVSLSKEDANLKKLVIGLGWDARATDGAEFDLDALAFAVTATGKVGQDADFVYYKNLSNPNGSIQHKGDNRTGSGDGDDEQISFDLPQIPAETQRVIVAVNIHEAVARRQNFGQVQNAYIRCFNEETGKEIARYDLSEDASVETAMIFGELYRHNGEWKFKAVGQGFSQGLPALCANYGIDASY